MNTFTKHLVTAALAAAAINLHAAERPSGFYVGALLSADSLGAIDISHRDGSGTTTEQHLDTGGGASLSFGYQMQRVRFEIEGGIKRFVADEYVLKDSKLTWRAKDDEIERAYGMVNVYYDHPLSEKWDWYVGGGLGVAKIEGDAKAEGERFSYDASKFSWQLMTGFSYHLTERVTLGGGVRFATVGSSIVRNDTQLKFESTASFEAGLRYRF